MDPIFKSSRFLLTTIVLDVMFLGIINSTVFPIEPTPVVAGFILLVLSPAIAYAVVRYRRPEK